MKTKFALFSVLFSLLAVALAHAATIAGHWKESGTTNQWTISSTGAGHGEIVVQSGGSTVLTGNYTKTTPNTATYTLSNGTSGTLTWDDQAKTWVDSANGITLKSSALQAQSRSQLH